MYHKPAPEKPTDMSDDEPDIDIEKLLKDVELFGNYLMLHCMALFACLKCLLVFGIFPCAESIDLNLGKYRSCIRCHVKEQFLLCCTAN